MFFFSYSIIPSFIFGGLLIFFSGRIANRHVKIFSFKNSKVQKILRPCIMGMCILIGLGAIVSNLYLCLDNPPRGMMKKKENQLDLLEKGNLTQGEVVKCWYQKWAPEGWKILYKFTLDSSENMEKIYWGSAQGPKTYYSNLSEGSLVTIIYNPGEPKINCEIYNFLNYPVYRKTFQESDKSNLLDKFRKQYEIKDYSFITWYDSQQHK